MMDAVFFYIKTNWFLISEIIATIIGFVYIYFTIRKNIALWPTGIISSMVYSVVFFFSSLYADVVLQFFYIAIGVYGWIAWFKDEENKEEDKIIKTTKIVWLKTTISTVIFSCIMYFFLNKFTDSITPLADATLTACSIVATWMLAQKYLEQWIVWIIVDSLYVALYFYKHLYFTGILYIAYVALAVVGFFQWRKLYRHQKRENAHLAQRA